MAIWNSLKNTVDEALALPEGSFAANFDGFVVAQSVDSETLLDVVMELQSKQLDLTAATQAGILVKAQKLGLLQNWAELLAC